MGIWDIKKQDIRQAIAECKRLGELNFLDAYGFSPARTFLLAHGGRYFQSKAIVGVAHKFSNKTALRNSRFSGGAKHSAAVLRNLGFTSTGRSITR